MGVQKIVRICTSKGIHGASCNENDLHLLTVSSAFFSIGICNVRLLELVSTEWDNGNTLLLRKV